MYIKIDSKDIYNVAKDFDFRLMQSESPEKNHHNCFHHW